MRHASLASKFVLVAVGRTLCEPVTFKKLKISVAGAGITGLWQALVLAHRGHEVQLIEQSQTPFSNAMSQYAGAMLAPYCEREGADPIVQDLGLRGLAIWQSTFPGVVRNGTLVVAPPRDRAELIRFAHRTEGHRPVNAAELAQLEPDLAGRFTTGLLYPGEAHVQPAEAMAFLLRRVLRLGANVTFGHVWRGDRSDYTIDCRGYAARNDLKSLRGVRGERIIVGTQEVRLSRPVRLLHPRFPLYVVPWEAGTFMIGATLIETEDVGPVSLRSALELLGTAYALNPAFAEARIIGLDAGIRPAFADNLPKIGVRGRRILVNGLYRHGFLLAPVLAELVADFLESGATPYGLFGESANDSCAPCRAHSS